MGESRVLADGLHAIGAVVFVLVVFCRIALTKPGLGDYQWVIGE